MAQGIKKSHVVVYWNIMFRMCEAHIIHETEVPISAPQCFKQDVFEKFCIPSGRLHKQTDLHAEPLITVPGASICHRAE